MQQPMIFIEIYTPLVTTQKYTIMSKQMPVKWNFVEIWKFRNLLQGR